MFAKSIVLSDEFLDMPLGARCLYTTMGMVADDDGFVNNAKTIIRMVGATEDDLKVLVAKRYIIPFDDGVIVIRHWRINNLLRSDRHHDTFYLEHKAMLLITEKGEYELNEDVGIPSIGKPSIGKYSIEKNNISNTTVDNNNLTIDSKLEYILNAFNNNQYIKAKVLKIPFMSKRYNDTMLSVETYGFDTVLNAISTLDDNEFFRSWKPSFDWVVNPNNMIKIIEGNYKAGDNGTTDWDRMKEDLARQMGLEDE